MLNQTRHSQLILSTSINFGNIEWSNLDNARIQDGLLASCDFTTLNISKGMVCANFGFSIPQNALINSVDIDIVCQKTGVGYIIFDSFRFIVNGVTGSKIINNTVFPPALSSKIFTFQNNFSLTPEKVNKDSPSFFGIVFGVIGQNATANIDSVRLTINYELMNELFVNTNGEWKNADSSYIKVNGVWKPIERIFIKDNNVWK